MFRLQGAVLIVGRAKSGLAVERLLRATHDHPEIFFYDDQKNLSDFESPRELLRRKWAHVILSPGVPEQSWFQELRRASSLFSQEIDVAAASLDKERVLAITGSIGKSTCAWVAKEALTQLGQTVFLGGNFGIPLSDYALNVEKGGLRSAYVLLELSSYQIERMAFMVDRGIILNLFPNHLDHYPSLEAYYDAKLRLLQFCREGTWGLLEGGDLLKFSTERGAENRIHWIKSQRGETLFEESKLIGPHNRRNLFAVKELLEAERFPPERLKSILSAVQGLPHRLEVFEKRKISFVNDSKATTVESVLKAHEALREHFFKRRFYWLLGGRDKAHPWQRLKRIWSDSLTSFLFFGEAAETAKRETGFEGPCFPKLSDALSFIESKLLAGDVLILSPAGASQDEFKNFEERGDFFKMFIESRFK